MFKSVGSSALLRSLVAGLVVSGIFTGIASANALRRFEVSDSIEMADFTTDAIWSPDNRWFVTITQRGVLPQGVTEATIWLFDAESVRENVLHPNVGTTNTPAALAKLSATINGDGGESGFSKIIPKLTWDSDSHSLLFLGRDGRENRQLFRVGLIDRKATPLTPATQDVVDYVANGSAIVYLAGPNIPDERVWTASDPSVPDIVVGTGQPLGDLLYPLSRLNNRVLPTEFEIWRIRGSAPEPILDRETGRPMRVLGSYYVGAMGLSPDAAHLVAIAHAARIPSEWERYEVPNGLGSEPFHADPSLTTPEELQRLRSDYSRARQYLLFDLEQGTQRPLLPAPAGDFLRGGIDQYQAAWSPDGRYIAVTGTFLPLDHDSASLLTRRPCDIAVVSVVSSSVDCLLDRRKPDETPAVNAIAWENKGSQVVARSDDLTAVQYTRHGTLWQSRHRTSEPMHSLRLTIEQDLDEPPALFATDIRSRKTLKIFDPNPQLADIARGSVAAYSWKTIQGQVVHGGLAKPPDFSSTHRYPLVIQTHGFSDNQFFRTGFGSNTAAAGRALAGRDILVLQVREPHNASDGTWREATERGTAVYLAAIDQLTREGLVDPKKVGIAGYSRMGTYVVKALEEAPDRFAAAVVANTDPGALFGYYMFIDTAPNFAEHFADVVAGERPYGQGLQRWLERAPGFNTDRIHAPVLISAGDPGHLIALWSLYAPLRDQGKPVELQYIRSGHHNFTKPLQVLAHQEMLTDWFDFWLNNHEDNAPEKSSQYARWHEIKRAWEQQHAAVQNK